MLLMRPHFQKERYRPFGFYIQNKIMLMDVREKTDDEKILDMMEEIFRILTRE